METAITAHKRSIFDRYRTRLTLGAAFSIAVHTLILSLRLGIPGLGLPGLELPWSERRAQVPVLTVRIANHASVPNEIPAPRLASTPPRQAQLQQQSLDRHPAPDLPDTRTRQAPQPTATAAIKTAKALTVAPALAKAERKRGAPPPEDQAAVAPANAQSKVIALDGTRPSEFSLPNSDADEWWRAAPTPDNPPVPLPPTEATTPPGIALHTPKPTVETAQTPAPAVQKPAPLESFEHPDQTQAHELEQKPSNELATEQAAKEQGEEILKQEAARLQEEQLAAQRAKDLEDQKQEEARKEAEQAARLLAAQKLEEEKAAKLAEELAARKQEEARQAELAEAERQIKEQEARRQAEEITRRQVAALALQKQLEEEQQQAEEARKAEETRKAAELARAKQQQEEQEQRAQQLAKAQAEAQAAALAKAEAEALAAAKAAEAARQQAEAAAAERARIAAASAAAAGRGNSDGLAPTGNRSGSLIGNALDQAGKLARQSESGTSPTHNEPNPVHRSIFGSFDHDINRAMYEVSWRAKIERNGDLNYAQSSREKKRTDPVVTVAVRRDGSVQEIVINQSSGVADLDAAVRRIVMVNAPYSVFPANLASKYDVIEIRSVWNFEERLRLREVVVSE